LVAERRYGGHNVVLEIQACMPSPPKTFRPYMRGVYIAYIVVSWAYFGVAFTGEPRSRRCPVSSYVLVCVCLCLPGANSRCVCSWPVGHPRCPAQGPRKSLCEADGDAEQLSTSSEQFTALTSLNICGVAACAGYWAYGNTVASNILFSLQHPKGVIALASAMGACCDPDLR